jgi:hypothetical protein
LAFIDLMAVAADLFEVSLEVWIILRMASPFVDRSALRMR